MHNIVSQHKISRSISAEMRHGRMGWETGSTGRMEWGLPGSKNYGTCNRLYFKLNQRLHRNILQPRMEKCCRQNSEFPAIVWCLWWLPPHPKLTLHTHLSKDLVSPDCELNVWMPPLLLHLKSPCPDLWGAVVEKEKHWTWNPKAGFYSQHQRGDDIHHW